MAWTHKGYLGAALLILGMTAGAAAQDSEYPASMFMTGAEPISPEDYAKLPKQQRFRSFLPKSVDLSAGYPPPGFQGPQPNCVAWATTYAARSFLHGKNIGRQPRDPADQMSPAYVYNRLRPAGTACVGTIRIVDALALLQEEGVVSLADFPDDLTKCTIPAPATLKEKAAALRIGDWRAVDRETPNDWRTPVVLDDIKGALSRGAPVIFAMPTTPDFIAFRGDGIYQRTVRDMRNYHAMAIIGYDEDRQALRIMNSWGAGWGDQGYAWIGYDTFKLLAGEAYSLEAPRTPAVAPAPPEPAPEQTARQKLDSLIADLKCGSVSVVESNGRLSLSGFTGTAEAAAELQAAALAADPRARWSVAHHAWPQCEAELTLARPLATDGVSIIAQTATGKARSGDPIAMKAGDLFGVLAETTADRPHLSIVYLQADGSAVELYRGVPEADARDRLRVGIGTGGTQQRRFEVAEPYGDEMLIAIASREPLFGTELKGAVTERQFLTLLRAKLAAAPADSVAAAAVRLRTSP